MELPGRGTTFVREIAGPPGAPTVVLLHGLIASGGLNWFQAFEPLSKHFRVVAPDLRGHGRGLRTWRRFRLADCADDVAELMSVLDIDRAIAVGYSMGGPVAQLLWHRHPARVSGLVMCATSNRFVPGVRTRMGMVTAVTAIAGSTRIGQLATRIPVSAIQRQVPTAVRSRPDSFAQWAAAEMRRHDPRVLAEALAAVSNFNSTDWLHQVDVPTALMITKRDKAIPAPEQLRLLLSAPSASTHIFDEGHTWCAKTNFGPAVARVCREVAGMDPHPRANAGGHVEVG